MSFNKKTGFILAEVLVAIASLATGVIVLGTITNNALSTINLSKDYLVAQNLVTEGVEVVKNLRDTNWMLYPNDKKCWLTLSATCAVQKPSDNSNYIAVSNNGTFQFKNVFNPLNLDSSNSQAKYQLYIKNSPAQYVGDLFQPADSIASKYFRSIKFVNITDTNNDGFTDTATAEVKVQWKDGAKTREINKKITLYNYL